MVSNKVSASSDCMKEMIEGEVIVSNKGYKR